MPQELPRVYRPDRDRRTAFFFLTATSGSDSLRDLGNRRAPYGATLGGTKVVAMYVPRVLKTKF